MEEIKVITPKQIREATGLTKAKLRFWGDGTVMNLTPSIAVGHAGSPSLYSLGDYYILTLALSLAIKNQLTFTTIGRAVDAIAKRPDWPEWAKNRGALLVEMSEERVVLFYDYRMPSGELRSKPLLDAIRRHNKPAGWTPDDPEREAVTCTSDASLLYLHFDLKEILDEADQRLAKILR